MHSIVFFALIPFLIFGAVFGISFTVEPRRQINGVLFNLFLLATLAGAAMIILDSRNRLLIAVCVTLFLIFVLLVLAVFALHLLWLLWNAIVVWRRESHSLGNMLTLFLAIFLLLLEIGASLGRNFLPDPVYDALAVFFTLSIGFGLLSLYNFLTILVLYNLRPVRHRQDYLIVLGAGLLNGDQISPLLAARINAAINFYHKQVKKGRKAPTIIFSGGQGQDEKLPEGLAMKQYAVAHGIPERQTLVEDQSKTTFENMQFSAKLIRQTSKNRSVNAAFFTNNYHLFRAGIFAKEAGLKANGVGAATSFYFLPNAVIREYIALVVMQKKYYLIVFGGITILALGTLLLQLVNVV